VIKSFADKRTAAVFQTRGLKGDRRGRHSIRINDQWRISFVWQGGNAHEVEIVEYH
jgi:proteic killer suppression protein